MATMTPGDCGSAEHDAEAIAAIRRGEAKAAADLIGADYLCLEFRDLAIFNDDESRRRVTEVLRRVRPDLVLTAPPVDYLCDHEMTSLLVRDACFAAPMPNYVTRQWEPAPPLDADPPPLLRRPDRGDRPRRPPACRPVSSSMSRASSRLKRQMLACHASQRNWLLRQHGIDEYLDSQAQWGARRGARSAWPTPRGSGSTSGTPIPQDNLLLSLIGQAGSGSRGVRPDCSDKPRVNAIPAV